MMKYSSVPNHPEDLITQIEVIRSGFFQKAIRKVKEASPYAESARQLLNRLQCVKSPHDLINNDDIRTDLITAAGFSDKAITYFSHSELNKALLDIVNVIVNRAGADWRAEVVYRFLLTRGDSLGSTMRNVLGDDVKIRFAYSVLSVLEENSIGHEVTYNDNGIRIEMIIWRNRTMLFDNTPKIIGKNIDVILLRQAIINMDINELIERKESYLVCGELKGGFDPTEADEHWKTAYGALCRIRDKLGVFGPKLFFAGTAIENSVANEIYSQLESGFLSHAANLTNDSQLKELTSWLVLI
jgi:type II restriction enzyme